MCSLPRMHSAFASSEARADVSIPFVSQIENGKSASLFTHHRIAVALDTTLHSLLEIAASPRMVLTRRDEGELFHLDDGASVRVLVGGPDHSFEARETIAAPGAAMHEPWVHIGEDLVIVLEGVIVYEWATKLRLNFTPGMFWLSPRTDRIRSASPVTSGLG